MKNLIALLALVSLATTQAAAQHSSAGASQSARLSLADAIDIGFVNGGSNSTVTMAFNTVNDFANGVTSAPQQLVVRSNKKFKIRVKARSPRFTYSGSATPTPSMSVSSVLKLKVENNNTGGQVGSGYTSFKSVSTASQEIIKNGMPGGNQTVSVKYNATPGYSYPAGNYNVDIIYTATQS